MLPHQGHWFQVLRTGTISRKRLSVVHQAEYLNRRLVVSLLVVTATVIRAFSIRGLTTTLIRGPCVRGLTMPLIRAPCIRGLTTTLIRAPCIRGLTAMGAFLPT